MSSKIALFIGLLLLTSAKNNAQEIDLLILNRDYQRALAAIDRMLESEPTAELYFKKGLVYEKLMNFDGAVTALQAACSADSTGTVYLEELAEAWSGLGNHTDAALCLQRAAGLDPDNLVLKGKLGQCLINLKKYQDACSLYSQIYRSDSTNTYYNRYFAYAAYQAGQLDLAVRLYDRLASQKVRDVQVYLNLASISNRQKNFTKSVTACMYGLNLFKDHPALLLKWAELLFQNKDYGKAQYPYERYLACNDSTFEVLKSYGICLYFSQFEEEALKALDKCYQLTANDPIVNFYIGACYKKLKQFPESVDFFKLAIETATPFYLSDIYQHLGQVYGLQREFDSSITAYQEALKLDPTNVELLFEIATTYEEMRSNQTIALNYYQNYLKQAGEQAKRADYALDRIKKLKEELFFEQ
ncbi:MAG: tetratricopeptide repeat protein [Prolixibacteraceae bacterium]